MKHAPSDSMLKRAQASSNSRVKGRRALCYLGYPLALPWDAPSDSMLKRAQASSNSRAKGRRALCYLGYPLALPWGLST
ncbi:hypothetical protein J6590_017442 [Homalodisca vitripennis]|nr:hypothetical protein J6590_017442 [Homalodisca vitripennis]